MTGNHLPVFDDLYRAAAAPLILGRYGILEAQG